MILFQEFELSSIADLKSYADFIYEFTALGSRPNNFFNIVLRTEKRFLNSQEVWYLF